MSRPANYTITTIIHAHSHTHSETQAMEWPTPKSGFRERGRVGKSEKIVQIPTSFRYVIIVQKYSIIVPFSNLTQLPHLSLSVTLTLGLNRPCICHLTLLWGGWKVCWVSNLLLYSTASEAVVEKGSVVENKKWLICKQTKVVVSLPITDEIINCQQVIHRNSTQKLLIS